MATGDIIAFQIMGSGALPSGGNIDGNGVIARIRLQGLAGNIGGAYDLSKLTGTGASPGWNRAKVYSATNITRNVALTEKIIRRPFPNETLRIEAAVGSDLDIYAYLTAEWFVADTLSSVSIAAGFYTGSAVSTATGAALTNSSTRAYRMPQISWVGLEPWRRMTSAGLTVEAIIDHHNARDGQPVPAVDFYVTRSAVTSTGSANAVVLSDEVTAPYRPGVYRATVPIGSLSQGEGDLGAIIYPWVGTATWDTNTADFGTFPCTGTPKLYPVNIDTDGSYAPAGAYISHTGVTIGSPSIGPLSAMGAYVPGTTPAYGTIKLVADATRAYNNSGARARAHDDMAGVFAVIPSGVTVGAWGSADIRSQTTYPPGLGFFGITVEAGASRSNTGLGSNRIGSPSRVLISGAGIFPGAAGITHNVSNGIVSGPGTQPTKAAAIYTVVRNCTGTGNNDNTNPVFWQSGYTYFYGNNFTSFGDDVITSNAAQFNGMVNLHGSTIDNSANNSRAGCQSASIIGCLLRGVQISTLPAGGAPDILGRMVHSVRAEAHEGTIAGFSIATIGHTGNSTRVVGVRGESWVNVVLRKTSATAFDPALPMSATQPILQISADLYSGPTDQPPITNVNMAYMSAAGARWNGPYNEAATTRVLKELRQIGIAAHQMNTKADLFASAPAASGNRTGTFAYRFGNARFGIVTGDDSANDKPTPEPVSWLGDALPPLSQYDVGYSTMWVSDTSHPGTNSYASPGDYAPQSVLFSRVPAGRAATAFDLFGRARRNDGFGAAGAVERLVAMLAPASARSGQVAGSPGRTLLLPLTVAGARQPHNALAAPLVWAGNLVAASTGATQSATAAGLTIALAVAASNIGQPHRAAMVSLLWAGDLFSAGALQGQRASPAVLVWSAALPPCGATAPHRAQATLLASIAVANWLLPVFADQPQRVVAGRLFAGSAASAVHTLVPDPVASTLFVP